MPTTLVDLKIWEDQKDIDKFCQILKYLYDEQFAILRYKSLEALARIRDVQGLPYFLSAIEDFDERVSDFAHQESLKWAGQDIDIFCEFLEKLDQPDSIIYQGLKIISKYSYDRVFDTYLYFLRKGIWIVLIRELVTKADDLSLIISKVGNSDPAIRFAAVSALGLQFKNHNIDQIAISALCDEDVQVRYLTEKIIAEIITAEWSKTEEYIPSAYFTFTPYLLKNLKHEDHYVRGYAVEALGTIGDTSCVDDLLPLLTDPFSIVRTCTINALYQIRTPKAFKPLKKQYQEEPIERNRQWIISSISRTGHPLVFEFLQEVISKETNKELRINAIRHLGYCNNSQAFDLVEKLICDKNEDYLLLALKSLEKLKDPRSVDLALDLLNEFNDVSLIQPLLGIFINFKEKRAIIPLINLLTKKPKSLYRVVNTLQQITLPEPLDKYLDNLVLPKDLAFSEAINMINTEIQKSQEA